MEIFGWTIERNYDDSLPMSYLFLGFAAMLLVAYPIGYLFIDILSWVKLSPEQLKGGFPHVARILIGCFSMAIPGMIFMALDSPSNEQ